MYFTRRRLTALLLSAAVILVACVPAYQAAAKDGGNSGNSGSGSSNSGGSGSSGSSGSGSNSGSGSSGHGGGYDHSGHGGGDDDGGGEDHGGSGSSGSGGSSRSGRSDYDRARDAVREGRIMPLKSLLQKIDARRYGRVIDVSLSRSLFSDVYQLKLRDGKGTIRTLRVDARNGEVIGDK